MAEMEIVETEEAATPSVKEGPSLSLSRPVAVKQEVADTSFPLQAKEEVSEGSREGAWSEKVKPEEEVGTGGKRKREVEARQQHWRTSRMVEDYVNLVSDLMVPNVKFGRYGFAPEAGEYPVERPTLLGVLMSPCRRPSVFEKWSPREIAVFEGAMALYGKDFRTVQRFVQTKNTKEIIEFYYLWKMSSHYTEWKRNFVPEFPSPYDPEEAPPRR